MVEIIGVDIGLLKVPRSKLSLAAGAAGVSYECVHVVHLLLIIITVTVAVIIIIIFITRFN